MNAKRARWARHAVGTFQKDTGLGDVDGLDTAIGDMLGDLMHLCDQESFDFNELIEKGRHYYEGETDSTCKKCKRTFDVESGDGTQNDDKTEICSECEDKATTAGKWVPEKS
jgi:hypothetical protein